MATIINGFINDEQSRSLPPPFSSFSTAAGRNVLQEHGMEYCEQ